MSSVSRASSISPWRQFDPSILDRDAILPAPNAWAGRVRNARRKSAGRRYEGGSDKGGMALNSTVNVGILFRPY